MKNTFAKSFAAASLCLSIFSACTDRGGKIHVIGDVSGMPSQPIFLEEVRLSGPQVVDSTRSNEKGHFELGSRLPEPGLYRVRFGTSEQAFALLSADKGNYTVKGNWNRPEQFQVAGNPATASLQSFLDSARKFSIDYATFGIVTDSMRAQGKDTLLARAEADMKTRTEQFTAYIEKYADTTRSLPNAIFAAAMLNPQTEGDYLKAFSKNLESRFNKNAVLVREFNMRINNMTAGQQAQAIATAGPQVGAEAPAISAPTPDGKTVTLASLRGKYVLVDFWASWCGPCRAENPNVVAAFQKFKNKNFTILGVSLDNKKDKWQEAIAADGLTWTHISDLAGWESIPARDYQVQSIPANFLVDPQGKIVAKDLRGPALEAKLAELVK